ncbi:MAG: hypothetical protein CL489_10325 [Acidobacteria bacterium]|nr:hypothetical protein [Acidobacteriota bacterium]|tara:strand:+ start:12138 stop:12338 length:201 start_codon:yes stop_codon:yes gene_type:complete
MVEEIQDIQDVYNAQVKRFALNCVEAHLTFEEIKKGYEYINEAYPDLIKKVDPKLRAKTLTLGGKK